MTLEAINSKLKIDQYDVVIVGAGISGIGAAYWLKTKCPTKRITILEARENLGGTWDLFKYPGIRSDSDMFTFGYRFKPWQNSQSLSDGASILKYLKETVAENSLSEKIKFGHKVSGANWSSKEGKWEVEVEHKNKKKIIKSQFLFMCSGYYSYDEAHRPKFEGEEKFRGKIISPQFWPKDLDYTNKRVVVVGSGATAITLVPAMAKTAARVTMLQRSPAYVATMPNQDNLYVFLKKIFPDSWAYRITRWRNLMLTMALFSFSKLFPKRMKSILMKEAAKELPPDFEVEKHFNPSYNPWEQRLCVVPDADLFKSIKDGKADVVTDEISHFTENGLALKSGEKLEADIIVLATGLKIKLMGGACISIDYKRVKTNDIMIYKGMMVGGVPNFIMAFGYTNNSWTLKVDLTANYVCKLLNYMDRKKYAVVVPQKNGEPSPDPFLNLDSSYIHRAKDVLPKQGVKKPWRVYQNYFVDMLAIRYGRLEDKVLKFERQNTPSTTTEAVPNPM